MFTIYRTSRPPIEYRASFCSCAFFFRLICVLLRVVCPIIICVFAVLYDGNTSVDSEMPVVIPGSIQSFKATFQDRTSVVYPLPSAQTANYPPIVMSATPVYDGETVTEWTISLQVDGQAYSQVISVEVVFAYEVRLNRWARNQITAVSSFSQTFPIPASHVSVSGDLVLEQNEIIDFRGSFQYTNLTINPGDTLSEILNAQDNLSTLFYVDWGQSYSNYGQWKDFTMDLTVRVREMEIIHSIPLVSSIESVIILYLSTSLFCMLILRAVQGFVFRNNIIQTWPIPLYSKPKTHKKMH